MAVKKISTANPLSTKTAPTIARQPAPAPAPVKPTPLSAAQATAQSQAQARAAQFTLTDPVSAARAGQTTQRAPDGTTYFLVPQTQSRPAAWVAQRPGQTNFVPVNLDKSGVPSIGTGQAYSNRQQLDSAVALGQKFVAAEQAKQAEAAARTQQINDLSRDFSALISQQKVTQADIDRYQSQMGSLGATVPAGSISQAQNQIQATAKAQADQAAAEKAAAERAAAEKLAAEKAAAAQAAAEKAAADRAAAAERAAAEKAAAEKAAADQALAQKVAAEQTAKIQAAQSEFTKAVNSGQLTEEQLDTYQKTVQDAGGTPSTALVNQARSQITANQQAAVVKQQQEQQATALAASQKQTALNQQFETQLTQVKTQDDLDRVVKDAEAAGAQINAGTVDRARNLVQQNQAQVAGQRQAALNQQFESQLATATTTADIDRIVKDAEAAGATVNAGVIDRARGIAQQQESQAQAQRQAELAQPFQTQLQQATTTADIDRIVDEASKAGVTFNAGQIDRARGIAQQQEAQVQQQAQATKAAEFAGKLNTVGTQAQLDQVLSDAQAAGVELNSGQVQRAQQALTYIQAQSQINPAFRAEVERLQATGQPFGINDITRGVQVTADQQRQATNQATQAGLMAPGPELVGPDLAARDQQNIQNLIARDPAMKATYDQLMAAGQPFSSSDLIRQTQGLSDQQRQELNAEVQAALMAPRPELQGQDLSAVDQQNIASLIRRPEYRAVYDQLVASGKPFTSEDLTAGVTQTAEQARLADREAFAESQRTTYTGPQIPEGRFDQVNQQNIQRLLTKNDPGYQQAYNELVSSGQPFGSSDLVSRANQIVSGQRRAELQATQAGLQAKGSGMSIGEIFGMVALMYVGGAIFNALSTAGSATAGLDIAGLADAATGLANAGAGAGEIAATLEAAGLSSSAAIGAAEAATAAVSGAVPSSTMMAVSGITPEMLAVANATLDPIAALNAAAGWTAVDVGYLAAIGAPAGLIATAEATNVALGLPASGSTATAGATQAVAPVGGAPGAVAPTTTPLNTLSVAETQQLMSGIDPNLINTFAPVAETAATTTADLVAADAAQLAAQGLSQAAIEQNLVAAGLDSFIAADAAQLALQGVGSSAIAQNLVAGYGVELAALGGAGAAAAAAGSQGAAGAAAPTTPVPPGVTEAEFIAADAAQLTGQGLAPAQVESTLIAAGADPIVAADAAQLAAQGLSEAAIAQNIATVIPTPPAPVPPTPPANPMAGIPGGGVTEAEFVAADAAQLTAQGLGPAQVESTLIASGVDPFVAADAAQLAGQGLSATTINQTLGGTYPAGDIIPITGGGVPVVDRVPDYVNPNPTPDKTFGEALTDYGKALLETNPLGTLGAAAGAGALASTVLGGQQPKQQKIEYGPIDPTVFGAVTTPTLPGVNPGFFVNPPVQRQTTSPVQARYDWQARPGQSGTVYSPQAYQQVTGPAVPFGLQQMYSPQTETVASLLQGVQRASQQAPYNLPQAPLV